MAEGVGSYRTGDAMRATCDKLVELRERYSALRLDDRSRVFKTEWLTAIELGFMLDVAEAVSWSALEKKESRGPHQRLVCFGTRDDENFLKHSTARYRAGASPQISFQDFNITRLPPAERGYGGGSDKLAADPA